ncbi:MAG: adenylate/guanylate cyclase domain-containing protein, partial [Armatimonadota bacterium]
CFVFGGLALVGLVLVDEWASHEFWERHERKAAAELWRPSMFSRRPWLAGLALGVVVALMASLAVHYNKPGFLEHFAQEQLCKIRPRRAPLCVRRAIIDVGDAEFNDPARLGLFLTVAILRVREADAAAIVIFLPGDTGGELNETTKREREARDERAQVVARVLLSLALMEIEDRFAGNLFLICESPTALDEGPLGPLVSKARAFGYLECAYASRSLDIIRLRRRGPGHSVAVWVAGHLISNARHALLPPVHTPALEIYAEMMPGGRAIDTTALAMALEATVPWRGEMVVAQDEAPPGGWAERPIWLREFVRRFASPTPADRELLRRECKDAVVFIGPNRSGAAGTPVLSVAGRAVNTVLWRSLGIREPTPIGSRTTLLTPRAGYASEAACVIVIFAVTALAGIVGAHFRSGVAAVLIALGLLAWTAMVALAYACFDVILPIVTPAISLVVAGILGIEASRRLVEVGRERTVRLFGRYVSEQVAQEILDRGAVELGGERRKVTVLFADIRGFGRLAESLPAEEVVEVLNDYFSVMIDVIFEYGGTLDKFIGDAIMAVWGAPMQGPEDSANAVRAAVTIRDRINELSERRASEGKTVVEVAIGVSTGEVVAGNIGDIRRMEYTVIGDGVNVASRLQEIASRGPSYIVISESTYGEVQDLVEVRQLGTVEVRHREEPVEVYELIDLR